MSLKKIADFTDPNVNSPPAKSEQQPKKEKPAEPQPQPQGGAGSGFSDPNSTTQPKHNAPSTVTHPAQPLAQPSEKGTKENVIKMQGALIRLSNIVGSHDSASLTPGAGGEQYNAFNKMFTNQYLNPYGGEYITTQQNKNSIRSATKITDFRKFINSISQLGSGGAARPDGIWKEKTDRAVAGADAFATALFIMLKDLGADYKDMTDEDIENFRIPNHNQTPDIATYAPRITELVNKLIKMYEFFKENYLEHPDHKESFKGKPLLTLAPPKLDPKDAAALKANMQQELASTIGNKKIRLFDLESLHRFKEFLKENKIEPTVENINKSIKKIQDDLNKVGKPINLGF